MEGIDETLASDVAAAEPQKVVIRAGASDYADFIEVNPSHYVVGAELARGGMGRISVARDRRLGRSVAIKELLVDSPTVRVRFDREVRITARLQHPSIVNLLEAGAWPTGEPFYAMKLVAGDSLDNVIAARTTLAARLALLPNVIAVVDALAYAHSQRVIHRDLKPANVLVGAFGETVVIDWGLAKDLAASASDDGDVDVGPARFAAGGETVAGAIMGTPAYMPPEQALGETVDERADVYSLGAILYQTLAGRPPFTGKSSADILSSVITNAPVAVDTGARADEIPRDLVTIVKKAMAKSPADRYPTAGELADDLKKFQTGQLVGAHRYTSRQLFARWLRKNRIGVTIASIALVVLASLGVFSYRRIDTERAAAVKQHATAENLIGFMLGELRTKLQPLGKLPVLGTIAEKAIAYYADQDDDSASARRRAIAIADLGEVVLQQTDLDAAIRHYRESLALADLPETRVKLANALFLQGKTDEALAAARTALAALTDPLSRATTHRLIGDLQRGRDPDAALVEYRASLASLGSLRDVETDRWNAHGSIGDVLLAKGDHDGALVEYRAQLAIVSALVAKDPNDYDAKRRLATTHDRLGDALRGQGRAAEALDGSRASAAITAALVEHDPTNTNWLRDHAVDLWKLGDATGALAIGTRLVARDPTNAAWQRDLAMYEGRVGEQFVLASNIPAAVPHIEASLAIRRALADRDPTNTSAMIDLASGYSKLGDMLETKGDIDAALASYRKYDEILAKVAAAMPDNAAIQRELSVAHDAVAEMLVTKHEYIEAIALSRASLAISKALPNQDDLAYSYSGLGKALLASGDAAGALVEFRAALAIREKLVAAEPDNEDYRDSIAKLRANIALATGKPSR